ncbi:Protein import receptor MAS20-related [Kalmanozyma brasiliensis GHG001]|uniref:Mitochondrial import receptor subunit TOM20 n=1 Tax=Kalmanozyma brasiliensis (strain GHG001) TaxID=1365824 RepID=V5EM49_KALBG|nr:Protein import receptor MAS20-related [Kalmanozyma brasiliensis GHG001]EST06195.1 Protein import receptor MAS20-related [Kalmanozyma brasiliensis GHG001]
MKTSQIVLTSLSVLGVAGIGYAVYFDHRRRNDPAFRKKLAKQSKKSSKVDKKQAAKRAQQEDEFIAEVLAEARAPGAFPAGVEEREQYFLKYVSQGEQLVAMGNDKYLDAAASFFRAMKVYPQPVELIMIYQKAVPKEVFDTIMKIVSKDIASGGGVEGGEGMSAASLDEVDDDAPTESAAAKEEDDEDKEEDKEPEVTQSAAPASNHHGTDSGTTSSQEWDTLSATSLNEAPSTETAVKPEEPKVTPIDTSASVTTEAVASPSKQKFSSDWSPAPVFGGPSSPKKAEADKSD